ncbi:hypothetical protein SPF06_07130 [Sinomonas sp. JGH33]|uniref:Uncharacterized protein n=1 Tax=Sinomonas terricola TaxID=3110330 RepID=A0ABU5T4I7_9MICC|nr:hypothetical protein [Sinomonas sp. JGH33]MEA5454490.1 hypothetical protein [Sinomonas sp. JGH33]
MARSEYKQRVLKKYRHLMPFSASHERTWPRAGVRRNPEGLWQLVMWLEPDVMSGIYAGVSFKDREEAIELGGTIAGAHRAERRIEAVA